MTVMLNTYRDGFADAARWSEASTARADKARGALLAAARRMVAEQA